MEHSLRNTGQPPLKAQRAVPNGPWADLAFAKGIVYDLLKAVTELVDYARRAG